MPLYDVTIYLANGTTAKIKQQSDSPANIRQRISEQLAADEFELTSIREKAVLFIKRPGVNIIGYLVDDIG